MGEIAQLFFSPGATDRQVAVLLFEYLLFHLSMFVIFVTIVEKKIKNKTGYYLNTE